LSKKNNKPLWRQLSNKYLRDQHELMTSFGYTLARWSKSGTRNIMSGHPIYERDGFGALELSCTPHNEKTARKRLLDELRRRHPEHPMWKSRRPAAGRRRVPKRTARPPVSLRVVPEIEVPPALAPRDLTGPPAGVDCGRRWLSDLDYSCRPCPSCGGAIRAGASQERAA
jgi:hypothetical protein